MTAVFACNAFTDSTGRDARDPILLAATSPVAAISMTITARDLQKLLRSRGVQVQELAHTHAHLLSIHSHWGSETCSVERSSPGSAGRHGVNAVQLHPLLEVGSLV